MGHRELPVNFYTRSVRILHLTVTFPHLLLVTIVEGCSSVVQFIPCSDLIKARRFIAAE